MKWKKGDRAWGTVLDKEIESDYRWICNCTNNKTVIKSVF